MKSRHFNSIDLKSKFKFPKQPKFYSKVPGEILAGGSPMCSKILVMSKFISIFVFDRIDGLAKRIFGFCLSCASVVSSCLEGNNKNDKGLHFRIKIL